ncbi:TonB-denpendent receptor precursor [Sphingobium herbicidovorans NBRC 16415]|uniref:TonB-denpendent receptor n=1 Tax=Sphingobium herbicidovorans (strain ATCC 700291 / DSM 11019 / CCUG 56400 / KCTC 2939 / LMG 18315 / NBRC 16415 / MH) TaxID=1219045 RepID=A0A086P884_SPHHM|nr:TonB-dependent receptor [Sphingobium herbicidovorans]KFG89602.1 TonB-denpendent receptor precursor [Sphingobium herbicidovorans NBRC 16415]
MSKPLSLARMLLITSALSAPAAMAQTAPDNAPTSGVPSASEEADAQTGNVDVSIPGSDIIVTGRRTSNVSQAAPQVVNILSAADIKRTGEGDIAGSLQRVTGLSVASGGFVYVRGLGDRYSLALLNGSPLPSPEPLKRVVPLDIFPTSVIASTLVQKSFSANFPGEFGGGVINLTTKAIPVESYLEIGLGSSANTETSGQLGYTHYGAKSDWTGFDDGTRDVPPLLQQAFNSGVPFSDMARADLRGIAMQFQNSDTSVVQRTNSLPFNFSASLNGGTAFDIGSDGRLGILATASYNNKWRTRDTLQQASLDVANGAGRNNQQISTENQVTVNGLLGVGLELGDQKLRWTNIYIRDTLKRSALAIGQNDGLIQGADYLTQQTAWYERQLIDTQFAGEFKLGDLSLDVRGSYANSQREAPYEREFVYVRTNVDTAIDPVGDRFVNALNRQRGDASVTFSDLNEDLWSAGVDLSYKFSPDLSATIGYAFSDTKRTSSRYELHFDAVNLPLAVQQLRPDYLLSDASIQLYDIGLLEFSGNYPVYDAALRTHAGYAQVKASVLPGLSFDAGVRFEKGRQSVTGVDVYDTGITPFNQIRKEYWLPAATITLEAAKGLQFRLSGSKTIARPQFRELIAQPFLDPESNRFYRGNPFLQDSELWNADLRAEWYMGRDERLTAAAFYKKIKNPIETYTTITDTYTVTTSFANAPEATLYGFEVETQKYLPLDGWSDSDFFQSRRIVLIGNYTYTQSELKVGAGDTTIPYSYTTGPLPAASDFFQDGVPLTGQSDHLVNLQIGLEDTDKLSQQTLLLTYASPRVTSRGPNLQPDIKEKPGVTLDFVARQGVTLPGRVNSEFKFEVRNILGRKFQEFQELDGNKVFYNRYKIGTTISASLTVAF